jgi:hypothetical protein
MPGDPSDSDKFLCCFFSFAGSLAHQLRAPGRRVCPLAVPIGGGVAPQWSPVQASIRRLRSVVAMCAASLPRSCYHDHELSADAHGSLGFAGLLDVRPGKRLYTCSATAVTAARGAVRRRWVATQKLPKNRQQNMKAV